MAPDEVVDPAVGGRRRVLSLAGPLAEPAAARDRIGPMAREADERGLRAGAGFDGEEDRRLGLEGLQPLRLAPLPALGRQDDRAPRTVVVAREDFAADLLDGQGRGIASRGVAAGSESSYEMDKPTWAVYDGRGAPRMKDDR
jgi:hypothetical protein